MPRIRPSQSTVRKRLESASKAFEQCWSTLELMKNPKRIKGSTEAGQRIIDFQATLTRALFELGKEYRSLSQEKDRIVKNKLNVDRQWFRRKLKTIARLQADLVKAIAVGKSLGDAFAWFFVRDNPEPLFGHIDHEPIFHSPPGIGGLGELMFVEKIKSFQGLFPLYHGITTFLRIGDVRFFDLRKMQLAVIGEIKTDEIEPGKLRLRLAFMGLRSRHAPPPFSKRVSKQDVPLPDRMERRLQKQVLEMGNLLKRAEKPIPNVSLETEHNYAPVATLARLATRERFVTAKAGDGLLLGAYKTRNSTLVKAVGGREQKVPTKALTRVSEAARQIMSVDLEDNALFISRLHYRDDSSMLTVLPGMPPMFWWDIPTSFVKEIYFHQTHVFTLYNPAFFVKKLRALGLRVVRHDQTGKYHVDNNTEKHKTQFEGLGYLIGLIQHYLWSEETAVEIVRRMMFDFPPPEENSRVELQIVQRTRAAPQDKLVPRPK